MKLADKHVLILEDEPIIAFALEDMLIDQGATVVIASSLGEATETLSHENYDFAILDVNLHGEKSYPLAYQLKDKGIPFVFATGYGDAEHPEDFAHVPTLTKPYSLVQIVQSADEVSGIDASEERSSPTGQTSAR